VGDGGDGGRLRCHRREETHTLPREGLFLSMPFTNLQSALYTIGALLENNQSLIISPKILFSFPQPAAVQLLACLDLATIWAPLAPRLAVLPAHEGVHNNH